MKIPRNYPYMHFRNENAWKNYLVFTHICFLRAFSCIFFANIKFHQFVHICNFHARIVQNMRLVFPTIRKFRTKTTLSIIEGNSIKTLPIYTIYGNSLQFFIKICGEWLNLIVLHEVYDKLLEMSIICTIMHYYALLCTIMRKYWLLWTHICVIFHNLGYCRLMRWVGHTSKYICYLVSQFNNTITYKSVYNATVGEG